MEPTHLATVFFVLLVFLFGVRLKMIEMRGKKTVKKEFSDEPMRFKAPFIDPTIGVF